MTPAATAMPGRRRMAAFGRIVTQLRRDRSGMLAALLLVGYIAMALAAPLIADRRELAVTTTAGRPELAAPSAGYPLGTDSNGRSVLALLVWGARISLYIGILATVVAVVIGTAIGVVAGYRAGRVGRLLMAIDDFVLVLPFLPLTIVLAVLIGRTPTNLALVIGATSWAGSARLVRAQALTIRTRGYVERAEAMGAGGWHVIRRHILPGVMPLVMANATLIAPGTILAESALAFLGFGNPAAPSWGKLLSEAQDAAAVTTGAWWYYVPAGLAIIGIVMAFTLLGRALERILDPRLAGR